MTACLICGSTEELTVEHIIPQTLWKRFGVDPNTPGGDVPKTRTTLCRSCNAGTAELHRRSDMMALIETGTPITKRSVQHLADWAFWVLLLLGLARGSSVVAEQVARALLLARFATRESTSIPKGVRVYAGIATTLEGSPLPETPSFAVARTNGPGVYRNRAGEARGMTAFSGQPLPAAQSIGLGKIVVLVLESTESSGADHEGRLDLAATAVGLTRIHPLPSTVPHSEAREYDLHAVRDLFVTAPFGNEFSLLPEPLRWLLQAFHAK